MEIETVNKEKANIRLVMKFGRIQFFYLAVERLSYLVVDIDLLWLLNKNMQLLK